MKKKDYAKILVALCIAYILVGVLSSNVFMPGTPKIRPYLAQDMIAKVSNLFTGISNMAKSGWPKTSPENELKDLPLQNISKGVYAKENGSSAYTLVKINDVDWLEYTYNVNGKIIKINVPKGQSQPEQSLVENLYK